LDHPQDPSFLAAGWKAAAIQRGGKLNKECGELYLKARRKAFSIQQRGKLPLLILYSTEPCTVFYYSGMRSLLCEMVESLLYSWVESSPTAR
jgi:hypothetical protein